MAEDFAELRPGSTLGEFDKVEFCLEGVRRCECFVGIITARHGTRVSVDGIGAVPTSFFEAELFEAALLRKPTFIFVLKGYEPEGRLAKLLTLLEPAFPQMKRESLSEDAILRQIDRLTKEFHRPRWLRNATPNVGAMVDVLFGERHREYDPKVSAPPVRFLEGRVDASVERPDPYVVDELLSRVREATAYQTRLTLVWFAIRLLMGAPFADPKNHEFRPLWKKALGYWTSSGAWYGLHGHFSMSCLAALGSLAEMVSLDGQNRDLPHGPLASEYYSIAKLTPRSNRLFDLALQHIQLAITLGGNETNQRAIRASIFLRTGHVDAALADYRHVAEARKNDRRAYGEALSEWGYALFKAGNHRLGLDRMEEGLALLREAEPSGFRVRAMRKLAEGYACSWKVRPALDLAAEAHVTAQEIGAFDQIHFIERLAARVTGRS